MQPPEQPRWRPTRKQLLWTLAALAIVAALTVAVLIGYRYDITLWNWIKLLIFPAVIVGGGLWFNRHQRERELDIARELRESDVTIADERPQEDRKIAQERAETDREIADQRAQDDALQAYLNHIGELLLDKDRPLRQSKERDEVGTLARARTLTVLTRLEGERKGSIVRFLYESDLITKDPLILDLRSADLSCANLRGAQLSYAELKGADLIGANISKAILSEVDLGAMPT
jgi:Pentapeptide repeats (8 copies)